ncbi:Octopamine receptor 1 [Lamellibrachia satsuma]|nr:Octopamine receptor 1 [Lamellibrachia satsuma]
MSTLSDVNNTTVNTTARCDVSFDAGRMLRATFLASVAMLVVFTLVVIVGNSLVVIAVFTSRKLRTTTNNFIVSLACADLLVGVMVLPLSGANEVLSFWPFGKPLCSVWLAVDVWTCTASILHLCAISLDRYLAISYPFKYPSLMSPRRSRILVATVWVASFIICFPPLIGWKDGDSGAVVASENIRQIGEYAAPTNSSQLNATHTRPCVALPQCTLTSDQGYVIYSALGSFWIPMLVMAFFYWKIYRTAVRTTGAMKRGVLTKKMHGGMRAYSSTSPMSVTLRIHRGGTVQRPAPDVHCRDKLLSSGDSATNNYDTKRGVNCTNAGPGYHNMKYSKIHLNLNNTPSNCDSSASPSSGSATSTPDHQVSRQPRRQADGASRTDEDSGSCLSTPNNGHRLAGKMSYIKVHLKKMNKEKKAAKTVGIIVGCFIVSWLPFFSVYLAGAFCSDCISPIMFKIFFWLGYCNSAMNPFVYAFFSRDFRFAFKRLLRCDCRRQRSPRLWRFNTVRLQGSSTKNSESISE